MDIGNKIKNARNESKLTQEQAAEALGVSRQTISNWENQKSYPDIVSVVKMSDLYSVSLDYLLKGEKTMSDYMDYLEESTNTVKSKTKFSKLSIILSYLLIWAGCVITFWIVDEVDAAFYSISVMWFIMPLTIFIISLITGIRHYWEDKKWCITIISGIVYMLTEYLTFSMANMTAFSKLNTPDLLSFALGIIFSLAGLVIGHVFYIIKKKKSNK